MPQNIKPIPNGYHTVTPFLTISGAENAIEFYQKAFGAEVIEKYAMPDGRIMHAVIKIGNSLMMIADEFKEYSCGVASPISLKGSTVMLHIYVEDVDTAFNQAVQAGAKVKMPVADMFWGDRYGQLEDPFGHHWSLSTHIADVTPEQINNGANSCFPKEKPETEVK